MPNLLQAIGVAIHEFSPMAIGLIATEQKRRELEKVSAIQKGSFAEMKKAVLDEGYEPLVQRGKRKPVEAQCPTCKLHSTKTLLARIWTHLHQIPETMPHHHPLSKEEKEQYRGYVESILANLPCSECSSHALAYVKQHPIDSSSREGLTKWLCSFHNSTRERLGQPILVTCR